MTGADPGRLAGLVPREVAAALVRDRLVDASGAAAVLGLAGRTSVHYLVVTGQLVPLARTRGCYLFWLPDVRELARTRSINRDVKDQTCK